MKYKGLPLRFELKYYVPTAHYPLIMQRIAAWLMPDTNMPPGGYHVRSLYFDDPKLSGMVDKLSGYMRRTKTRVRIYNKDPCYMRLEHKLKLGEHIAKQTCKISPDVLAEMLSGNASILASPEQALRDFYIRQKLKRLRPVVIVDYMRQAFVHKPGNVRVTFDTNLLAGYGTFEPTLSDANLIFRSCYPESMMAMEVKYDTFLPEAIKRLVREYTAKKSPISKYVLAMQAIRSDEIYGFGGIFPNKTHANHNNDTAPLGVNSGDGDSGRAVHLLHL